MDILGDDVIYEIACWLPVKELLSFGQTNKRLLNITSDEHLWRKYEEKLLNEIYKSVEDEEIFPDSFTSEPLKNRIRLMTNYSDYSKESGTAPSSVRDWMYYFKRPMWGLDLAIRVFFALLTLIIDRVGVMFQLNLDQTSWNGPLAMFKYIYDTDGISGFFLGWQYRLMLLTPFLFGGRLRTIALLTVYFAVGLEVRAQLGYHIDSYMHYFISIVVVLLTRSLFAMPLRNLNRKLVGVPALKLTRPNWLRHLIIYISDTLVLNLQTGQVNALVGLMNFISSLFSRGIWIGFVFYGVKLFLRDIQAKLLKYKTKLSDIEKEKRIYNKYLNKPFKINKLVK